MHPLDYATAIPPHTRVGRFVANEPQLSWIWRLLNNLPGSEVYLVGGTVRDSVFGKKPHGIHVLIRNITKQKLDDYLRKEGKLKSLNESGFAFSPHNSHGWLEINLPRTIFWNAGTKELRVVPNAYLPLIHDLSWRDFTSDAIAYSFNQGLVIDPFGGVTDVENGTLRSVGNAEQRFVEDPLRILRALRLAAQHGWQIADNTWNALRANLPQINRTTTDEQGKSRFAIPRHKIGYELISGLTGHVPYFLNLWEQSGATKLLLPELKMLEQIENHEGISAKDNAQTLINLLQQRGINNPNLLLVALLYFLEDMAPVTANDIIERLYLNLTEHEKFDHQDVKWFLNNRHVLHKHDPEELTPTEFLSLFNGPKGQDLMHLLEAVAEINEQHDEARVRLYKAKRRHHKLVRDIEPPTLLRGRDVVAMGVHPGPQVRKILKAVRDAQLDGRISTKDEAFNFAANTL